MALTILPGPLLAERTTLAIGGRALAEVIINTPADLEDLPNLLHNLGGVPFVLGKGSNLLVQDGDLPLVLLTVAFRELIAVTETVESVTLRVSAGIGLPCLLGWLADHGLTGLEGLVGIPGSLGGAVAMNAGSWGVDIGQVLTRVQVFTPELGLTWLVRDEFATGYRSFAMAQFATWLIVATAELSLQHSKPEYIQRTMAEYYAKKIAVQPLTAKSCGCAFKNPHGLAGTPSAGKLLDEANCRGLSLGGIGFSGLHANFLVNKTGGTSDQAIELLILAKDRVLKRSGISLEREVQIIPCL